MMFCFSITEVKLPRQCHSVQNLNVAFLQWPTCNSKLVCTLIAELSNLDDLSTLQPVCLLSVLIIAAKFINRCLDKRLPRVDCSPLTDNLPSRPPPCSTGSISTLYRLRRLQFINQLFALNRMWSVHRVKVSLHSRCDQNGPISTIWLYRDSDFNTMQSHVRPSVYL